MAALEVPPAPTTNPFELSLGGTPALMKELLIPTQSVLSPKYPPSIGINVLTAPMVSAASDSLVANFMISISMA